MSNCKQGIHWDNYHSSPSREWQHTHTHTDRQTHCSLLSSWWKAFSSSLQPGTLDPVTQRQAFMEWTAALYECRSAFPLPATAIRQKAKSWICGMDFSLVTGQPWSTHLLWHAVQGFWAADVETDEDCVCIRIGQWTYVVIIRWPCKTWARGQGFVYAHICYDYDI